MTHFITDHRANEPELPFEKDQAFSLGDLAGRVIATVQAQRSGWSTAALRQAAATAMGGDQCGIDAFADDHWVGSIEI